MSLFLSRLAGRVPKASCSVRRWQPHLYLAHQRWQDLGGWDPHPARDTVPPERCSACSPLHLHCPGKGSYSPSYFLSVRKCEILHTDTSIWFPRLFCLQSMTPPTWNDLSLPLWQKLSLDSFKCNLKNLFSQKCRPTMMSFVPCCCLHPCLVCLLPVLSCIN